MLKVVVSQINNTMFCYIESGFISELVFSQIYLLEQKGFNFDGLFFIEIYM